MSTATKILAFAAFMWLQVLQRWNARRIAARCLPVATPMLYHERPAASNAVNGRSVGVGSMSSHSSVYIIREYRPLSFLRVGSRSRRIWESPPIPTERYERRPCFCRVCCTCRSSDCFTIRQKRIRGGVR